MEAFNLPAPPDGVTWTEKELETVSAILPYLPDNLSQTEKEQIIIEKLHQLRQVVSY